MDQLSKGVFVIQSVMDDQYKECFVSLLTKGEQNLEKAMNDKFSSYKWIV